MYKKLLLLSILMFPLSAAAERTFVSDPVTDGKIKSTIESVKKELNLTDLRVVDIVFASGTQEYMFDNGTWKATGPKADLYPVKQRSNDLSELVKYGTHFMDLTKPGWKFDIEGNLIEVIAQSAKKISGASDEDVSWLHVKTQANAAGITDIFRLHTRAGKPPKEIGLNGERIGAFYQTIYVALK